MYAIGVLLFRLITGRMPFDIAGLPLVEAVQRILRSDTPRLRAAGGIFDQSLEEIAARAMARERDARYESAEAMASDLRAFLEGRRTRAADVVSAATADEQLLAIGLASGDISVIGARTGKTLATFERRIQSRRQPSLLRRWPNRRRVEGRAIRQSAAARLTSDTHQRFLRGVLHRAGEQAVHRDPCPLPRV